MTTQLEGAAAAADADAQNNRTRSDGGCTSQPAGCTAVVAAAQVMQQQALQQQALQQQVLQ